MKPYWQIRNSIVEFYKEFYSSLRMEDITDADHKHTTNSLEDSGMQDLGEYHDLYVQRNTLFFAGAFKNFYLYLQQVHINI